MSKPEKSDGAQKRMTIGVHITDQNGNPVVPGSVKDVQVLEHGKKLQVVDGPKSAGSKQIALLLDSNFHQRKVLPLEQQTAVRTPLSSRRRKHMLS